MARSGLPMDVAALAALKQHGSPFDAVTTPAHYSRMRCTYLCKPPHCGRTRKGNLQRTQYLTRFGATHKEPNAVAMIRGQPDAYVPEE
jgi:hypothetical protein